MKKVAVEFEQRILVVRTILVEIAAGAEPNFLDYIKSSSDEVEDIAERIENDGYNVLEISDMICDIENSSQDNIDYRDDYVVES